MHSFVLVQISSFGFSRPPMTILDDVRLLRNEMVMSLSYPIGIVFSLGVAGGHH